ncbi:YheC/YheD family protein [Bacillus sp. FJAT-27251]|uniref:YheC/YheD family protein n=1 Tax=Bacillus sp. FJAT-27251 TaxID=1684142 RepID=UPI0006A7E298|nr:YheC/YheD family protein [Bacillus sp. FJAT-27251]
MAPIVDPNRESINKWEMHKLLVRHSIKKVKIPDTELLSREALRSMLQEYHLLYIKPVDSWGGKGISTLEQSGNSFVWTIQGQEAAILHNFNEACEKIRQFYDDKSTIIQRGIPTVSYGGHPFDIRPHLYKEMDGSWVYAGDLVRIGGDGSIVSNVEISNGSVKPTDEVISALFPDPERRFSTDTLKEVSMEICHMLDQYHFFTEVGIDFGLDQGGNLWMIEVNTNDLQGEPDPYLFSLLPDQSSFNNIIDNKAKIHDRWMRHMMESFESYLTEKGEEPD